MSQTTKFFLSLLILISFTSCSLFSSSSTSDINASNLGEVRTHVKRLCLSGGGKGRIEFANQKQIFRYDAKLDPKQRSWTLALYLPVHGEELFRIVWGNTYQESARIGGNFYKRLMQQSQMQEFKKDDYSHKVMVKFVRSLPLVLKFLSDLRNDKFSNQEDLLRFVKKYKLSWHQKDETFTLNFPLDDDVMRIKMWNLKEGFYTRQKMALVNEGLLVQNQHLLTFDLFATICN